MTNHPPLTFYDIAMRPPVEKTCSAPNPWKARLALNFKNAAYKTNWVHLPDIASTRRSLNVPAGRKFADGSDFYTLPILHDAATDTKIGDSFDIAVYLQERDPDNGGDLFPALKENEKLDFECGAHSMIPLSDITECGKGKKYIEYANFNTHVDAAFTAHVQLMVHGLEFPDETAEQSKAEFCRRAGVNSWEFFGVEGEERVKLKESLKGMLGDLGRLFDRDAKNVRHNYPFPTCC